MKIYISIILALLITMFASISYALEMDSNSDGVIDDAFKVDVDNLQDGVSTLGSDIISILKTANGGDFTWNGDYCIGTTCLSETTDLDDCGAYLIGVYSGLLTNSSSTDLMSVLTDFDLAITLGAVNEDTIEAFVFDADSESVSGIWTWLDDIGFYFGTDHNWFFGYDKTTDGRLELTSNSASDTDIVVSNSGPGEARLIIDQILVNGISRFDLIDSELNDASTPHTLTEAELKFTIINPYKATPEAKEYDLPSVGEGWDFYLPCANTSNVALYPYGTERPWLNGTQLDAGEGIVNTSCTKGEVLKCYSLLTGSSSYELFCDSDYADWTEETP